MRPSLRLLRTRFRSGEMGWYTSVPKLPEMVNDLAGVSSSGVVAVSPTPQYIVNPRNFGALRFHHCLYALGSHKPYRPVVVRKYLSSVFFPTPIARRKNVEDVTMRTGKPLVREEDASYEKTGTTTENEVRGRNRAMFALLLLRLSEEMLKNKDPNQFNPWVQLWNYGEKEIAFLPKIGFEVGRRRVVECLCCEPSYAARGVHSATESIFIPVADCTFTIVVPPEIMESIKKVNSRRSEQMALEGRRRMVEGVATESLDFLLEMKQYDVRLTGGDVMFLPVGWKYQLKFDHDCNVDNTNSHSSWLCQMLRFGYDQFPELSAEQQATYIAADYARDLSTFYTLGGNNPFRHYT